MRCACQRLLVALWAGSLWSIGLLAAPLLFVALPNRALAGIAARQLFMGVEYLGVICGLLLMILMRSAQGRWLSGFTSRLVSIMLIVTVVSLLVVDPWLDQVRITHGAASGAFAWAHTLALLVYLALCGLGLWLVLRHEPQPVTEG
ncbi:MAG TPA: DUF4149 domain-containing protein [Gammaproteobacteria bacterium]|nr:DUF4149 domain-containing protein [Gammaproteobacteria bacterium]